MEGRKKEGVRWTTAVLTQKQRENIEELVQMTPQAVQSRVRRAAISSATVFDVYMNFRDLNDNNCVDLQLMQ